MQVLMLTASIAYISVQVIGVPCCLILEALLWILACATANVHHAAMESLGLTNRQLVSSQKHN